MKKFVFAAAILIGISITTQAQHTVVLKTGEKLQGVVMELQDDVLTVFVNREKKTVYLRDVTSIFFDEYVAYDGQFMDDTPSQSMKSADGNYTVEYKIKDRKMLKAPRLSNATQKKGEVVVEVRVNRAGTVLKTKAGITGSTTSDEYLLTKAEYACMGIKFNEHMTGPLETIGTVIIRY